MQPARIQFYLYSHVLGLHITPQEEREHNFVSLRHEKNIKKFSSVNAVKKSLADLDSMPLDHNLDVGEGIRLIL